MPSVNNQPKISPFGTDEILWYNPPGTIWGELGFAVANFGDNPLSLNDNILELVSLMGSNLQAMMLHTDADMRTPPSINTLLRVHKLIIRARGILAGRGVPSATPNMETEHTTPNGEPFLLYPCPYFKVRNQALKSWAKLILTALGEAMQHSENRKEIEISTRFAGTIAQYLQRIYLRMATEFFGVPFADANKPDFTIPDTVLATYDPSKWFTSTEFADDVPDLDYIWTERDVRKLRAGIPANAIVGLDRYPLSGNPNRHTNPTLGTEGNIELKPPSSGGASTGAFPAAPPP